MDSWHEHFGIDPTPVSSALDAFLHRDELHREMYSRVEQAVNEFISDVALPKMAYLDRGSQNELLRDVAAMFSRVGSSYASRLSQTHSV